MATGRNTIALGWKKRKMTKDKALKMALELIEQLNMDGWVLADFEPQMYACIAAIKETLSQSVKEQGSCAECGVGDGYALYCVECSEKYVKRAWVGLTDNEINAFEIWLDNEEEKIGWNPPPDIVKYLEAKLKEKNT